MNKTLLQQQGFRRQHSTANRRVAAYFCGVVKQACLLNQDSPGYGTSFRLSSMPMPYMHVYIYIYTYTCVCMCVCIFIYLYVSIRTEIHLEYSSYLFRQICFFGCMHTLEREVLGKGPSHQPWLRLQPSTAAGEASGPQPRGVSEEYMPWDPKVSGCLLPKGTDWYEYIYMYICIYIYIVHIVYVI